MSHTANESDKIMVPKEQIDSPSLDEGSCGGSLGGGGGSLKKGPWTSAEDSILVDYVKKHGEGNWNAVQKHSGLSRCGKSCRLRWANHLRPNLKKGAFTPEEEQLIIELHARMGNKWARMAAHLPGRTDNEIKNYWNTRIKRRQRAGLPLYPQNMALPPSSENQQGQALCEFSSGDKRHNEVLQANSYDIPDVIFDNYKVSPGVLAYAPPFPDISMGGMLSQGLGSQTYSFINPSMSRGKRLRESESLFPRYHGSITGALSTFDQFLGEPPEKTQRAFGSSYPFDPPDPCSKSLVPFEGAVPGSHATLNGNNPPSNPSLGHEELPSLQFSKDLNSWFPCFSSTPLEALDHYIQSPPATASIQSDLASPRNSGLLEDLLHEAQALRNGKKHSTEKSSTSSAVTPSDVVESSTLNLCESGGWEDYNDDPISPLGCSAASVFNECTPPISGSSLDEIPPSRGANSAGSEILMPSGEHGSTLNMVQSHISQRSDFLRPDVMLGADWHLDSSQTSKDHTEMNNALATLLGDDFREQKPLLDDDFREQKPMIVDTSSFTQRLGLDSYPWNNMPRACQMSEYP